MIHLFAEWEAVQVRIREARQLCLLLDYDGTLTPIVSHPDLAVCSAEMKALLEKIQNLNQS